METESHFSSQELNLSVVPKTTKQDLSPEQIK